MSCGGVDPTMAPQFESTWGSTQLTLPGTEDFSSLDVFNIFEDLNLSFDDTPSLFELLPECDLPDFMEDILGSSKPGPDQVRHDCMWAGSCVEDKERPSPVDRLQQECPAKAAEHIKDSHHEVPVTSVPQSKSSTVKCNQRSILRTNLNLSSSANDNIRLTPPPEDSDDSGRPETPDSIIGENGETDFKHEESDLHSSFQDDDTVENHIDDDEEEEEEEEEDDDDDDDDDEDEDSCSVVAPSDVTGQTVRTSYHLQGYESSEGLRRTHTSRFDSRPQQTISNHFFNDHSYHLSKSDVSASIPGNLTPSDSEDEIDVVSVCGEKGGSSRSSSQGALPTNPSARDRQALQQTMASAMKKTSYAQHGAHSHGLAFTYGRQPSGKLARMQAQRQAERKRRAQERDDSSEEDTVRRGPSKKRAKHHAYKHVPKRGHSFKMSSSDSEPDSCEKRSLHNNMERQRRVDLRNAFEDLRVVVPSLSPNPRAAKVVILKEASHFCYQLTADSKALQQESNILERERERLLARVSYLRKQVASMRMGC